MPPKGEQTRERIIELAAPVFNTKGYAGASMADILEATGLQKGGLYNHFASKEELAVAAFEHAVSKLSERWAAKLAGKRNAIDRLLAAVSLFDGYDKDPVIAGGCPIMNLAVEVDDTEPVLHERVRRAMDRTQETLRTIVRKGIEREEVRAGADPAKVASLIISLLEGGLMMSKLYGQSKYLRLAQDHAAEYIRRELVP